MLATFTKGLKEDFIRFARKSGDAVETRFPHKGIVPHDAVHFFVEGQLRMARGFWGMVAEGVHPEYILELAKAAGHASASRCTMPDPGIVELIQAERIVECFEADLWTSAGTAADLRAMAEVACAASHVPMLLMDDDAIVAIRVRLTRFGMAWLDLDTGGSLNLHWGKALADGGPLAQQGLRM